MIDDRPILDPMQPDDLGGTSGDEQEVLIPVSEIMGWWQKAKEWIKHWRETH